MTFERKGILLMFGQFSSRKVIFLMTIRGSGFEKNGIIYKGISVISTVSYREGQKGKLKGLVGNLETRGQLVVIMREVNLEKAGEQTESKTSQEFKSRRPRWSGC